MRDKQTEGGGKEDVGGKFQCLLVHKCEPTFA